MPRARIVLPASVIALINYAGVALYNRNVTGPGEVRAEEWNLEEIVVGHEAKACGMLASTTGVSM